MRWTRLMGAAAGLMLLSGCFYAYGTRGMVSAYSVSGRPVDSYYCYDCHGYRYFDPYYDWCEGYGFRFAWSRHPEAVGVYRERYVRIKEQNPEYGHYRYPRGFRATRRSQPPRDYETWRRTRATVDEIRGRDDRDGRRERRALRERPQDRDRRQDRERPQVREREDRKKKSKDGGQPPGREKRRDSERGRKQRHI